jgi:hypothetical protein
MQQATIDMLKEFDNLMLGGEDISAPTVLSNAKKTNLSIKGMESYSKLDTISVTTASVVVVGMLIDDSVSMTEGSEKDPPKDGKKLDALKEGIRSSIAGLKMIAAKGKSVHLVIIGFNRLYFSGNVLGVDSESIVNSYSPTYDCTPLVKYSIKLSCAIENLVDSYNQLGINAHVMELLLTDGEPRRDISLDSFMQVMRCKPHWKIQGLGIVGEDFTQRGIDEVFARMGIKDRVPARPEDIAAAMLGFSKSASAF